MSKQLNEDREEIYQKLSILYIYHSKSTDFTNTELIDSNRNHFRIDFESMKSVLSNSTRVITKSNSIEILSNHVSRRKSDLNLKLHIDFDQFFSKVFQIDHMLNLSQRNKIK